MAVIGGVTALLAALIGLTQDDLKRILAYSTVSQLGYMFLALGCGSLLGVTAGIFHVFTHAFFKALLFLGAGSVMHAMGDVMDIRRFSGLRRRLPITCCDVPVRLPRPWPGSRCCRASGARTRSWRRSPSGRTAEYAGGLFAVLLIVGLVTAFLTAFYTFRAFFKTFWGEERIPDEAGHHAHESPPVMYLPLVVLAVVRLGAGRRASGRPGLIARFLERTPGWAGAGRRSTAGHNVGLMIAFVGDRPGRRRAGLGAVRRPAACPRSWRGSCGSAVPAVVRQVLVRRDLPGRWSSRRWWAWPACCRSWMYALVDGLVRLDRRCCRRGSRGRCCGRCKTVWCSSTPWAWCWGWWW